MSSRPGHHIILANPFSITDNDDHDENYSLDTNAPPTTTTKQHPHRLPRHALFQVHIVVHQIANIPLISGEFGVQWKFKNVYTPPRPRIALLGGIVKSKRKDEMADENESPVQHQPKPSYSSSASSTSSASSSSSGSRIPMSSAASSRTGTTTNTNSATTPTLARGQTPFLRLKEHNVVWEHILSLSVRMDIDRSNLLLSCPLKLDILQRDSSNPKRDGSGNVQPTRFGVVHLDLAQYACKGEVTRRYLLRESKTNATLKLTTQVTYLPTTPTLGGAPPTPSGSDFPLPPTTPHTPSFQHSPCHTPSSPLSTQPNPSSLPFTAPPLPPGEILAGISNIGALGFGGEYDVYRTRPKGLDLYGPYYDAEEMEMDLLGKRRRRRASSAAAAGIKSDEDEEKPSFDPSRLPLAYGAKTTEMLIDALFNPVETSERRRESPFTVYVPASARSRPGALVIEPPAVTVTLSSPSSLSPSSPPLTALRRADTVFSMRTVKSPGKNNNNANNNPSAGIGAGLGIMGLGMGLGLGLGVGVGVVNAGVNPAVVDDGENVGESKGGGGGGRGLKAWWMRQRQGERVSRPGTAGSQAKLAVSR